MIAFLLLAPIIFLSVAMSVFMGMLTVFSGVMTLVMGAFMGVMMTWAVSFLTFMIIIFS